jgi:hypothetical protein
MLPSSAQELVRELIVETDHLSRTSHEANEHTLSGRLAALRTTLQHLERGMGGASPRFAVLGELDVVYQRIRDLAAFSENGLEHEELERLLDHAERLHAHRVTLPHPAYPAAIPLVRRAVPHSSDKRMPWVVGAVGLVTLAALSFAGWRSLHASRRWF